MTHNGGRREANRSAKERLEIKAARYYLYITHCRSAILFVALYSCREHAFTVMRVQTRSKSSKTGRICTHFPNRSLIFNLTTMKYNGEMVRPIRMLEMGIKFQTTFEWINRNERRRHFTATANRSRFLLRLTCRNLPFVTAET